jgi:filamentous hemagglutinin
MRKWVRLRKCKIELASGIYQLEYQLPGATKAYPKTVYDTNVYSGSKVADIANSAVNKALIQYCLTRNSSQRVFVNDIEFSVSIRVQGGLLYVPTAYPLEVKK